MRLPLLGLFALSSACATLAGEGRGDVDLPNTLTGPFRALKHGQVCDGDVCTGVEELPPGTSNGTIKYAGNPPSRSPSVLTRGGLHVVLYAARGPEGQPTDRVVRMESEDARAFDDMQDVLLADGGMSIGDPCAVEANGQIWLYYGVPGGIARAHSTDGLIGRVFQRDGDVTIGGAVGAWETTAPRAPAVVRLEDGSFRLFYGAGKAIGEAVGDGMTFNRVGRDPVVRPSEPVDIASLPEGVRPPFDDDSVDDPSVAVVTTVTGRIHYRLHYTGRDRRGGSSIGFAGRFGHTGEFERREGFVFGGKLFGDPDGNSHANAPTVAYLGDFALIYANIDHDRAQKLGIGIAPQRTTLPYRP